MHTPKEVLKAEDDLDSIDVIVLDEVDALLRAPGATRPRSRRNLDENGPRRRYCDVSYRGGRARSCWSVGDGWPTSKETHRRHPEGRGAFSDAATYMCDTRHRAANQWKSRDGAVILKTRHIKFLGPRAGRARPRCIRDGARCTKCGASFSGGQRRRPDRVSRFLKKSGYDEVDVLAPNEIRGLDLNGVDVVLSLGRPATCDDYLHVAGRTARAGGFGLCCTIAAHRMRPAVAAFASPLDIRAPSKTRTVALQNTECARYTPRSCPRVSESAPASLSNTRIRAARRVLQGRVPVL